MAPTGDAVWREERGLSSRTSADPQRTFGNRTTAAIVAEQGGTGGSNSGESLYRFVTPIGPNPTGWRRSLIVEIDLRMQILATS
jgi:hypothetical protein